MKMELKQIQEPIKRRTKEPLRVGLLQPRYVKRVGYEHDFMRVLGRLLLEAAEASKGSATFSAYDRDMMEVADKTRLDHIRTDRLIQHHPIFEEYRKLRPGLMDSLLRSVGDHANLVRGKMEHEMVFRAIQGVVQEHMRSGAERKIWFVDYVDSVAEESLRQWWRGPWGVTGQMVAKTGVYEPAWGGGEDWEPPYLANQKTHVIYFVDGDRGRHKLLKADTVPWEDFLERRDVMETMEK